MNASFITKINPWVWVILLGVLVSFLVYQHYLVPESGRSRKAYNRIKGKVRQVLARDGRCGVSGNDVISTTPMGKLGRRFSLNDATDQAINTFLREMSTNAEEQPPRQEMREMPRRVAVAGGGGGGGGGPMSGMAAGGPGMDDELPVYADVGGGGGPSSLAGRGGGGGGGGPGMTGMAEMQQMRGPPPGIGGGTGIGGNGGGAVSADASVGGAFAAFFEGLGGTDPITKQPTPPPGPNPNRDGGRGGRGGGGGGGGMDFNGQAPFPSIETKSNRSAVGPGGGW